MIVIIAVDAVSGRSAKLTERVPSRVVLELFVYRFAEYQLPVSLTLAVTGTGFADVTTTYSLPLFPSGT